MSLQAGRAVPGDREIALELPEESVPEPLWDPVDDLRSEEIGISPAEGADSSDSWAPVSDASTGDFMLSPESLPDDDAPWAVLTGTPPPLLGELAPEAPVLPEPRGVRALLTGSSPARLPKPRTPLPWRGTFLAEELKGAPLTYSVRLDSIRSELAVVDWSWTDDSEAPCELTLRLSDDGDDLKFTATQAGEPVVSLRGFLADRELRFDVLLVKDRGRRGLFVGRDVLAEGFLVDPQADTPATTEAPTS